MIREQKPYLEVVPHYLEHRVAIEFNFASGTHFASEKEAKEILKAILPEFKKAYMRQWEITKLIENGTHRMTRRGLKKV